MDVYYVFGVCICVFVHTYSYSCLCVCSFPDDSAGEDSANLRARCSMLQCRVPVQVRFSTGVRIRGLMPDHALAVLQPLLFH